MWFHHERSAVGFLSMAALNKWYRKNFKLNFQLYMKLFIKNYIQKNLFVDESLMIKQNTKKQKLSNSAKKP